MLVSGVLYAILATCTLIKSWEIFAPGQAQSSLFHPMLTFISLKKLWWESTSNVMALSQKRVEYPLWVLQFVSVARSVSLAHWALVPLDIVFWEGDGQAFHSLLVIGGGLSVALWGLPQVSCRSQGVWDLGPTHSLCWGGHPPAASSPCHTYPWLWELCP